MIPQPQISALALKAGCDQNDGFTYEASVGAAVAQGLTDEAAVDTALGRIMTQRFRVGAFDPPASSPYAHIGVSALNAPAHARLALRAATEAITLLANEDATLPLLPPARGQGQGAAAGSAAPVAGLSIAVVGPMANLSQVMMGSKEDYSGENIVTLFGGIAARAARVPGGGASARVAQGVDVAGKEVGGGTSAAAALAAAAAVTVVCVGIDKSIEHEGGDRATIGLPDGQLVFLKAVVEAAAEGGGKVVVVLVNGGPLAVDWLKTASAAGGPVGAVVEAFAGGQAAGTALAAVLFGDSNPSGMLPFTIYPEGYVDQVDLQDFSMRAGGVGRTYRFFTGEPLWPFGAGLSYSNFTVAWQSQQAQQAQQAQQQVLRMSPAAAASSAFTVLVTNHGPRDGAKTVLAFARTNGTGGAPLATVFGMQKVFLQVGQNATLSFHTGAEDVRWSCPFCSVDKAGRRAVRAGRFTVTVGGDASESEPHPGLAVAEVGLVGAAVDSPLYDE